MVDMWIWVFDASQWVLEIVRWKELNSKCDYAVKTIWWQFLQKNVLLWGILNGEEDITNKGYVLHVIVDEQCDILNNVSVGQLCPTAKEDYIWLLSNNSICGCDWVGVYESSVVEEEKGM